MGSSLIQSTNVLTNAGTLAASFSLAVGDLVLAVIVCDTPGGSSMTDTLGTPNTYTNEAHTAASGNGEALFYSLITQGGTAQFTISNPGTIRLAGVYQYRATNGYSGIMGSFVAGNMNPGGSSGANLLTSSGFGTPNLITTGNALLFAACYDQNEGTETISAGTSPTAYTLQGSPATNYFVAESAEAVGSISTPITFGNSANGYNTYHIIGIAVGEVPSLIADGTSTGSTTVATGTGGTALPAISVGQFLDIMLLATTTTAITETGPAWVGSSGGTFFVIRTYDDHANGYIWDHWGCYVTSAVAAPVIKTTWTANPTTALAISVGIISSGILGTNPFTNINFSSQHKQTSTNGTDAQVSGLTGAALTTGALYTIGGWGFSANVAAAPAAGTGFTQIGTVWAALGTGACMTYETKTIVGAGAQAQATFTPVTGNTYTFAAAFNDIPLPAFPAGPMPRQIYIMP